VVRGGQTGGETPIKKIMGGVHYVGDTVEAGGVKPSGINRAEK